MQVSVVLRIAVVSAVLALAVTVAASAVCDSIQAGTSIGTLRPPSAAYIKEQSRYWSTAAALHPTCILTPSSAEEVAAIVRALLLSNESFAIKSGGHNPNNGFAGVRDGPLISTRNLNEVILDRVTETVRVGPGNRWDQVSDALQGTGYSAVGGRIGNVGVGGYMLGAGLSFMSTEYGWAANSVLELELVLANASIVTVTAASHPDLFLALKGGGNNLGIVSSFLLRAYRQGQVWGGNFFYHASESTDAALLAAVRDFTATHDDPKAAVILTAEVTGAGLADLWILFLYYNGPSPPPATFAAFRAVGPWLDTTQTRSMHELLTHNNWSLLRGSAYTIGTETTPLPTDDAAGGEAVLAALHAHWRDVARDVRFVPGLVASVAYQPVPRGMAAVAEAAGGDLLGLDAGLDRVILEYNYSFLFNATYEVVHEATRRTVDGARHVVLDYTRRRVLPDAYLPLFQNDAYATQDYFSRLRTDRAELAARVRDEVDPLGLWRDRTGGFKMRMRREGLN